MTDKQAILERASEILSQEPTPDELAENEARRQQNRIARIMTAPTVYSAKEDALQKPTPRPQFVTRSQMDTANATLMKAVVHKFMDQINQLEARIVELEKPIKPRVRVVADSQKAAA